MTSLSAYARAASGHCYFNLKDATAQVRCVLFRQKAQFAGFLPGDAPTAAQWTTKLDAEAAATLAAITATGRRISVTSSAIQLSGALASATIVLTNNGTVMQKFNSDDMAHKIPRCIEWVSSIHTLEPGDILATGTNHRGLNAFMDGDVVDGEAGIACDHHDALAHALIVARDRHRGETCVIIGGVAAGLGNQNLYLVIGATMGVPALLGFLALLLNVLTMLLVSVASPVARTARYSCCAASHSGVSRSTRGAPAAMTSPGARA